jgi:hypothetical protein
MEHLKLFEGKKVDLTIKGETYKGRTLHFVGINSFGQKVISTTNQAIHYIEDWNDVTIVDYVDERLFKD